MIEFIKKLIYYISYFKSPIWASRFLGVKIGNSCRLIGKVDFGSEPYLIKIGNHVSITNSSFITHDGAVWIFRDEYPKIDLIKKIRIGNNVFIGANCIILYGVSIGDNVIVGAGSIVTKDLESNSVYAGVPARKIKSIESYKEKIINEFFETKGMTYIAKKKYLLESLED